MVFAMCSLFAYIINFVLGWRVLVLLPKRRCMVYWACPSKLEFQQVTRGKRDSTREYRHSIQMYSDVYCMQYVFSFMYTFLCRYLKLVYVKQQPHVLVQYICFIFTYIVPGCLLFFFQKHQRCWLVFVWCHLMLIFFDHRTQSPDVPSGIFCKARLPPCRLGRTSDNEMPDNLCRCSLEWQWLRRKSLLSFLFFPKRTQIQMPIQSGMHQQLPTKG